MDEATRGCSLVDLEDRAVGWLSRSLRYFDPDTYGVGDRSGRLAARKALLELSILVAYRARLDPGSPSRDYLRIVDCLSDVTSRRSYRDLVARQPRTLWLYGFPYVALRLWGREDSEYRGIIEQCVTSRYAVDWERLPYRQLDYLHLLKLLGLAEDPDRVQTAFSLTMLASYPNVLMLEEDDVYAMTHAVYYMTDFGLTVPGWPASFDVRGTRDMVSLLLARFRAEEQADLVAELVASSLCLGAGDSNEVARSLQYLHEKQRGDGSLATPAHLVGRLGAGELDDEAYRDWKAAYHTTAATALTALMARRSQWDGNYPVATGATQSTATSSSCESLVRRVDDGTRRAASWLMDGPSRRPGQDTEAIRNLAQDVLSQDGRSSGSEARQDGALALIGAARAYRLGEVGRLLEAIVQAGDQPRLARDAVEFLLSQQRPDGSFGFSAQDDEDDSHAATRLVWTADVLSALRRWSSYASA